MRMLYELTPSQAISYAVKRAQKEHPEFSKKDIELLVKNALVYNVVIEQILEQVDFLLEDEEE